MSAPLDYAQPGWHGRWLRWRFHFSALVLLIPVFYLSTIQQNEALNRGTAGLGMRELPARQVGPWTVRLAEKTLDAPVADGEAGHTKPFVAAFCKACIPQIRAAYLRIGKPRNLRAAGALFYGSLFRTEAYLVLPKQIRTTDTVWLTVEGWDGSVHQTSWPLGEVSPAIMEWLKQQGKTQ